MLSPAESIQPDDLANIAFEFSGDGILITDADHTILQANPAFCDLSGYSTEALIGRKPFLLRSGEHDEGFYHRIWRALEIDGFWQGEISYRNRAGDLFYVWETIKAVKNTDGSINYYISSMSNMAELKKTHQKLASRANYDSLTTLPNRHYFKANLHQAIEMSKRSGDKVALLFIDLDKFKPINDRYGHKAGDLLLTEVANRLSDTVRQQDTTARIGGDEFVILMPKIPGRKVVEAVVERIQEVLAQPVSVNSSINVLASASIGVSIFPDDVEFAGGAVDLGASEILELADHAMYTAKANAMPSCFYDQIAEIELA